MKKHKALLPIAFGTLIFTGCTALMPTQQISEQNITLTQPNGSSYKPEHSLVQNEEIKKALAKIIQEIGSLQSKVSGNTELDILTRKQSEDNAKSITELSSKVDSLSIRVSSVEQNATQKVETLIAPVVVVEKPKKEQRGVCDKAVKIDARRASLLDKPSGLHIKYAKKNEKYCYDGHDGGYYHLSTSGLFIKDSDATSYIPGQKQPKNKSQKKDQTRDENSTQKNEKPKDTQAETKSDKSGFFQQDTEVSKASGFARDIAKELFANPNVNDTNIKEQCAVSLMQRGYKNKDKESVIESCSAIWKIFKTKGSNK